MSKLARTPSHGRAIGPSMLESLEGRMMFSAPHDFAGVGIRFDGGPSVFVVEGQIAEDLAMSGEMRLASLGSGVSTSGLDWTRYVPGSNGDLSFETRNGFTAYGAQSGRQFIREDRWTIGSFVGEDGSGNVRDWAVLSEAATPTGNLRDWVLPNFQLQMTRLTEGGGTETFTLTVSTHPEEPVTESLTFVYALPEGDVTATKDIASINGTRITFVTGEVMYLTGGADEGVLLADLDNTDGIMGVASGRQIVQGGRAPNGRYAGPVLVTGPVSREFFGVDSSATIADVVVEFQWTGNNTPGRFFVYDRAAWNQGNRTVVNSGTWENRVNTGSPSYYFIDMTDTSGREMIARTASTRVVWFDQAAADGQGTEELSGVISSQEYRSGDLREMLAETDANGTPIAYMQIQTAPGVESIFAVNLVEEVGGEAVAGSLSVWWSASPGGVFIAGLSASGDVQVWRWYDDNIGWTYANLTDTVPGAVPIASHFAGSWYETGPNGPFGGSALQALAGLDANGNFVAYRQLSGTDAAGIWAFDDTGAAGIAGDPLPASVASFSGYSTSWGGHNFVGLDDAGQLWTVWWAPGLSQWQVTNLSGSYGFEALAGNIAAMRTGWDALHIIGTSATDGNLIVAWWAPGLDSWLAHDLTELTGGPLLEPGTLTAHFSYGLDTINFVGRDLTGNTRVYWWAPYTGSWSAGYLATAQQPSPDTPWQFSSTWTSQSLLGRTNNGHLVRLYWNSMSADAWVYQDVSAVAVSYFN